MLALTKVVFTKERGNTMKKLISVLLVILLTFSTFTFALAAKGGGFMFPRSYETDSPTERMRQFVDYCVALNG